MIGLNLRTSGLVKRGIGTVRQDVNISITEGNRVELKGVQDLSILPKLCAHEVVRQYSLTEIKSILEELPVLKDDFKYTYIEINPLVSDLKEGESVFAVRLPLFEKILSIEIQPGKDFGFEIFEKCSLITGIQFNEMFHSGEIRSDSIRGKNNPKDLFIDKQQDASIRNLLNLSDGDGYIAVRGQTQNVLHTMKKAVERIIQAFEGVPQETRRVLTNGNNEFLRVIHGKERLYPDTDTPPIEYPMEKAIGIRRQVRQRPLELLKKYESQGVSLGQISNIIESEKPDLFEKLV